VRNKLLRQHDNDDLFAVIDVRYRMGKGPNDYNGNNNITFIMIYYYALNALVSLMFRAGRTRPCFSALFHPRNKFFLFLFYTSSFATTEVSISSPMDEKRDKRQLARALCDCKARSRFVAELFHFTTAFWPYCRHRADNIVH